MTAKKNNKRKRTTEIQKEFERQQSSFWMERLRLFCFLSATLLILAFVSMGSIDYPLSQWVVTASRSSFFGNLIRTILDPFGYFGLLYINLMILVFIFLFDPKKQNGMLQIAFSLFLAEVIVSLFKTFILRFRPRLFFDDTFTGPNETIWQTFGRLAGLSRMESNDLLKESIREGMSFPSGHSAAVVAMACAMSFLFPKYKYFFVLIAVLTILQRIISGAHFASDTLVGAALALLISALCLPVSANGSKKK